MDTSKVINPDVSQVVTSDPRMARVVRNLNLILPRVLAIGKRWGFDPCRALFTLKSDKQLIDDLAYPLGTPVSRVAWWYGKAQAQARRDKGGGGHVFEFANISNPAHVVLGSTNDEVMHMLVIIHAWLGHVKVFTHNVWHDETERESIHQQFAQDEAFVRSLIENPAEWGWDRYEYFADAAHALAHQSGEFPTRQDVIPEEEHREMLKHRLQELEATLVLAATEKDREDIKADIVDLQRLLSCHPIVPTSDILGLFTKPENTPHLPDEARRIAELTRREDRYSTQVIGRTKTLHEGVSHFVDERVPVEPELDLIRLGFDKMMDSAKYGTMHDTWPIYWYSDPYALGEELIKYVWEKKVKQIGTEVVKFRRLKVDDEGNWFETDEIGEKEVPKYDTKEFHYILDSYDDYLLFQTFLTEEFFERLHKKSMTWVRKMITVINKTLKDRGWASELLFEGDKFPESIIDIRDVLHQWLWQIQAAQWMVWFGLGAPAFPVSQITLWQMIQIVETIASYDEDKHEFKRQMLLRTSLLAVPNIKTVDTGRYNNSAIWTNRHEYDPDFGPLRQSWVRGVMRYHWRYSKTVRLITMEILTDEYGRPWGPPRSYQYLCANGVTVKERWLN